MQGHYKLKKYRRASSDSSIENLFEDARLCFIRHKFADALELMDRIERLTATENLQPIYLNKALLHHLSGDTERAMKYYDAADDCAVKIVNYFAFCHRNFLYKEVAALPTLSERNEFFPIYAHNRLNHILSIEGTVPKEFEVYCRNLFGEQLLNDARMKRGMVQSNFFLRETTEELRSAVNTSTARKIMTDENRIGIYVNDIQRHQNTSLIFDAVALLNAEGFSTYVYFDNIFDNKLVRLLPANANLRHVVNLGLVEFHNLLAHDKISVLIDMTGNRLRNSSLAFALIADGVIDFQSLIRKAPLPLSCDDYFEDFERAADRTGILVIGDLKYLSDEEILSINEKFSTAPRLVFMSLAFNEPECLQFFRRRLMRLGILKFSVEVTATVRPFKKFLSYVSSFDSAVLAECSNAVERDEIAFTGTPLMTLLKTGALLRAERFDQNALRRHFIEELKKLLRERFMRFIFDCDLTDDFYVAYEADGRNADVNFTCNGDAVIFSRLNGS